jgi:hypothetical protein
MNVTKVEVGTAVYERHIKNGFFATVYGDELAESNATLNLPDGTTRVLEKYSPSMLTFYDDGDLTPYVDGAYTVTVEDAKSKITYTAVLEGAPPQRPITLSAFLKEFTFTGDDAFMVAQNEPGFLEEVVVQPGNLSETQFLPIIRLTSRDAVEGKYRLTGLNPGSDYLATRSLYFVGDRGRSGPMLASKKFFYRSNRFTVPSRGSSKKLEKSSG